MQFKVVQDVVKSINNAIQQTAIASVRSIKANVFSVKVRNFPKTQTIKGTITVANQKKLEKELKDSKKVQKSILGSIKAIKIPKSIRVDNFPEAEKYPEHPKSIEVSNLPKPLPYPKNMRVSNQPTKEIKEMSKKVGDVEKAVKKLKLDPKKSVQSPKPERVIVPPANVTVKQEKIDYDKLAKLFKGSNKDFDYKKLGKIFSDSQKDSITVGGAGNRPSFADSSGIPARALLDESRRVVTTVGDSSMSSYRTNDIDDNGTTLNIVYVGMEHPEGAWALMKFNDTDEIYPHLKYATIVNNVDVDDYSTAWTDRSSLEYSDYSIAF